MGRGQILPQKCLGQEAQHQPQLLKLVPFFLPLVYWIVKHSGSKWKGVGKKTSCHISKISIFCLREACGDLKKIRFLCKMQRDVEFKLRYTAKILSSVSYLQTSSPTFPFIPFSQLSVRDYDKMPGPFYYKK